MINYYKSKEAAEKLVSELGAENAIALYADVTNRLDVEHMTQSATAHYGQIDVFVNNALVDFKFDPIVQKSFIDLQWEDYQKQLNGKLKAVFHAIQSVLQIFIERNSGSIISIGTNFYQNPVVPYHKYTTVKAGLIGFIRKLIAELGQQGIKVNVVSGGLLKVTDASSMITGEVFDLIAQSTPLKKVMSSEEVVQLFSFLASEATSVITGQNVTIDGGITMNKSRRIKRYITYRGESSHELKMTKRNQLSIGAL